MYIPREAEEIILKEIKSKKITIIIGARQVGKTTLIERVLQKRKGKLVNLDIEIDASQFLAAGSLSPKEAIKSLGSPDILAIDEAQHIPETTKIVKGWYDSRIPTKIILLGSSSLDLLNKSAEPLTGRNQKIYLTPLLFKEVLTNQSWYNLLYTGKILAERFKKQIESLLLIQMVYGSYPETVVTENKEKYLLNLTSDYLLKDILHSGILRTSDIIKKLLLLLSLQIGSEVSTSELANNLEISRITVEKYLDLLQKLYIIFKLPAFSTNLRKEITKNSKIYFWDTGVRNALLKEFSLTEYRTDFGPLFENWIISEIAKRNLLEGEKNNLYFWRTKDKKEVDLIIKGTNTFRAFEIKWKKRNSAAKKGFGKMYHISVESITKDNFFTNEFILPKEARPPASE